MVNSRFTLNKSLFHRLRNLYKKPRQKDDEESIKAVSSLNQDLIPDFHSASLELNLARKLGPHIYTFTPLHFAVFSDATIRELKLLLLGEDVDDVAYNGMTPLHMALCLNSNPLEVVKCLIEHGADVNSRMISFQFTPLLVAVYTDRSEVVEMLIENGADVDAANDEGLTPLLLASALGNKEVVKTLVQCGAQVNNRFGNLQLTALHLAAMKVDQKFLKGIIRPDSEVKDEDIIILEMKKNPIAEKGREEIVAFLLENGADIHAKDSSGKTALHFAVQYENANVETLLKSGANVNEFDENGKLPLHYTVEHRQGCNLELLLKYDADIYDIEKIDRLAFRKTIEGDKGIPILLVFDAHINGIYEVSKISADRSAVFQDLLELQILEYLVKLEAAGLHITDKSKNLIDEIGFDRYYIECLNEVDRMKSYRIRKKVTMYDLLHMKPIQRSRLAKKCKIPACLESRFPIYWEVFQASFCKGKRKKKLLAGKKFSWYWITNGEVPDIYVKNAPDKSNRTLNVMSSYWYKGVYVDHCIREF